MNKIDIKERQPEPYEDVLFIMEDGDIKKGFINNQKQFMLGNQGMRAAKYFDIDNPVTHWVSLTQLPTKVYLLTRTQRKESNDVFYDEVEVLGIYYTKELSQKVIDEALEKEKVEYIKRYGGNEHDVYLKSHLEGYNEEFDIEEHIINN